MTLQEDLSPFLDTAEGFAVDVQVGGSTFGAIFHNAYRETQGVEGRQPSIVTDPTNIPGGKQAHGTTLWIGSDRYRIVTVEPRRDTLTRYRLAEAPPETVEEVLIISGRGTDQHPTGLEVSWLDELHPTSPRAEPLGGVGRDPLTAVLSYGLTGGSGHTVGRFPDLFAPPWRYLPPGAVIDDAAYWVHGAITGSAPGWEAFVVLQPMWVLQATWNQYRPGGDWGVAGCLEDGVDFDSSTLFASGSGFQLQGYQAIFSGSGFTALCESKKTESWAWVLHDDATLGNVSFFNGHPDNENPPFWRIVYHYTT